MLWRLVLKIVFHNFTYRPNPNGFYVDGPILNPKFKSFVGMHQVPVVYGMTIGNMLK